jgi:outer membrane protein assembly factor BamA
MLWVGNGFNDARDSAIYRVLGINYAQYLKADIDLRYYYRFNDQNTLAFRSFLGLGLPYGNSTILPFEKSYSAGGSNEIRAWKYRSLGPGSYTDSLYYDKTGDISLVLNLEYRFPIVSWFKGAFFVDAGNVWLVNPSNDFTNGEIHLNTFYKQIAIGAGFGLRLDFDFFILRLDGGFPLRNPSKPEGERWVGFDGFLSNTNFNFGIGYPF